MPLRSFGSVSKAELIKEVYSCIVSATDLRLGPIGNTWGALINAVNEEAIIQFKVPAAFTGAQSLIVVCLGVANLVGMSLQMTLQCGQNGQSPVDHGFVPPVSIFNTTANQLVYVDLGPNIAVPGVVLANDYCTLQALYDPGPPLPSNIFVLGAYLTWR